MGADSSDIYRSLEQRIDNVLILGGVLKTEPKSKQKTGTGNRGLGGSCGKCHGQHILAPRCNEERHARQPQLQKACYAIESVSRNLRRSP